MRAGKGFVTELGHVDVVCGEAFSAPESHDLTELGRLPTRASAAAAGRSPRAPVDKARCAQTAGAATGRPVAAAASASTGDGPAGLGPLKALSRQDSSLAGAGHRPPGRPANPRHRQPLRQGHFGLPQPGDHLPQRVPSTRHHAPSTIHTLTPRVHQLQGGRSVLRVTSTRWSYWQVTSSPLRRAEISHGAATSVEACSQGGTTASAGWTLGRSSRSSLGHVPRQGTRRVAEPKLLAALVKDSLTRPMRSRAPYCRSCGKSRSMYREGIRIGCLWRARF